MEAGEKSVREIEIGQIWKLIDSNKYYNTGYPGDYFIIASSQIEYGKEYYKVYISWWSGNDDVTPNWGGFREHNTFAKEEINEIGKYVGHMKDMVKWMESNNGN